MLTDRKQETNKPNYAKNCFSDHDFGEANLNDVIKNYIMLV